MPDNDAEVVAKIQTAYKLYLSGGAHILVGSSNPYLGYYLEGDEVQLSTFYSSSFENWRFMGWRVVSRGGVPITPPSTHVDRDDPEAGDGSPERDGNWKFSNPNSVSTTFTMPGTNVIIEAPWAKQTDLDPPTYDLSVENGTGNDSDLRAGTWTPIKADEPEEGFTFDRWEITGFDGQGSSYLGAFFDAKSLETRFIMGEGNITVTAMYEPIPYMLIVVNGRDVTGETWYTFGDEAEIAADPSPEGQEFDIWESSDEEGFFEDGRASETKFTMPMNTVIVTATYKDIPEQGKDNPEEDNGEEDNGEENEKDTPTKNGNGGPSAKDRDDLPEQDGDDPPEQGGDVSGLLDTYNHMTYIRGVGDNLFAPEKNTTRAEVAQMIYNLLLDKDVEITKGFPDVPGQAWYARAVNTLASKGIILGRTDGMFHPAESITRAEFTAVFVRFVDEDADTGQEPRFSDVAATHWAYSPINRAASYGWVTGYGDGQFRPDSHILRSEAVTLLNRVLRRCADKEYIDEHTGVARFYDVPSAHWAFYDIMEAYIPHDFVKKNDGCEVWKQ